MTDCAVSLSHLCVGNLLKDPLISAGIDLNSWNTICGQTNEIPFFSCHFSYRKPKGLVWSCTVVAGEKYVAVEHQTHSGSSWCSCGLSIAFHANAQNSKNPGKILLSLFTDTLVELENKSCLAGYLAIISNWNWMGVINWRPLYWLLLSSYCLCKWFVLLSFEFECGDNNLPEGICWSGQEEKHRWLSFNWFSRNYNGGLDCIGLWVSWLFL